MDLSKENANLRQQLRQLADARNQEILDLQRHFAEKIRELEASKGTITSARVEELEKKLAEKQQTIEKHEQEKKDMKKKIDELEDRLKESERAREQLSYSLERAKLQNANSKTETELDLDQLLEPLQEQLQSLAEVITQKQEEINRLQVLVHNECEERVKLQKLLGLVPKD